MKVTIVVIKLLFLGALFIVNNHNLHLIDTNEREMFIDMYSEWLNSLVLQTTDITGYVVKFEWLPDKESNFSSAKNLDLERDKVK